MSNELKDRIKKIRTENNLTQSEFAKKLGTVQNTITGYETGRRNPSGSALALMCEKFSVNEEWLKYGKGKMRVELPEEDEYSKAAAMLIKDNDEMAMKAVIEYWKLDSESKKAVWDFLNKLTEK